MQLILKRLSVWVVELILQAVLLGLLLIGLFGYDQHAFGKSLLIYAVSILTMFFSTGYLLTTAVSRAVWWGRKLWPYSVMATVLFLVHFEVLNVGVGGAFDPRDRVRIRVIGACMAFASTLAGTSVLRKWEKVGDIHDK